MRKRVLVLVVLAAGIALLLGGQAGVAASGTPKVSWSPCFKDLGPFQCGTVQVPLDYDSYFKPDAIAAAARFYTDDTRQIQQTKAGGIYFQKIPEVYGDLGEVLAGRKDGRRNDRERLISMNLGIAMDDMATAPLVLEKARRNRLGTRLPL